MSLSSSENNLKEEEAEYSVSIKDSKSEGEDESFPFTKMMIRMMTGLLSSEEILKEYEY